MELADLREGLGDHEGAAEALERALYIYPLDMGVHLRLAEIFARIGDWQKESQERLADMLERAMLAKLVAKAAAENFPSCFVLFLPFLSTGESGREPDPETAAQMLSAHFRSMA